MMTPDDSPARQREDVSPAAPKPLPRGIPFSGLGVGGREPDVPDVGALIDTSPRGQLLRFLDARVFDPILRATVIDHATPAQQQRFLAERRETALIKARWHDPRRTAAEIKAGFLSLGSEHLADEPTPAPSLRRAARRELRDKFLQLCQELGV